MGPRAGLDVLVKGKFSCPRQGSNPGPSSPSLANIQFTLLLSATTTTNDGDGGNGDDDDDNNNNNNNNNNEVRYSLSTPRRHKGDEKVQIHLFVASTLGGVSAYP